MAGTNDVFASVQGGERSDDRVRPGCCIVNSPRLRNSRVCREDQIAPRDRRGWRYRQALGADADELRPNGADVEQAARIAWPRSPAGSPLCQRSAVHRQSPQNVIRIAGAAGVRFAPPMDDFIARFKAACCAGTSAFIEMTRHLNTGLVGAPRCLRPCQAGLPRSARGAASRHAGRYLGEAGCLRRGAICLRDPHRRLARWPIHLVSMWATSPRPARCMPKWPWR